MVRVCRGVDCCGGLQHANLLFGAAACPPIKRDCSCLEVLEKALWRKSEVDARKGTKGLAIGDLKSAEIYLLPTLDQRR